MSVKRFVQFRRLRMRFISLVLLLVLSVILSVQGNGPIHYDVSQAGDMFANFMKEFNKQYRDEADENAHLEQFKQNLEVLNDLNDKNYPNFMYGIGQFTDQNTNVMKQNLHYYNPEIVRSTGK